MNEKKEFRPRFVGGVLVAGLAVGFASLGAMGCDGAPGQPESAPAVATQAKEADSSEGVALAKQSANDEINQRFVALLSARIEGQEELPSEEVFDNIQLLKGIPAGRFLRIMSRGYSRALGTNCTHCHVENDFSSDELRPKRAAREMAVMHRAILAELRKMESLETPSEQRAINCDTCHRGGLDPMREMQ